MILKRKALLGFLNSIRIKGELEIKECVLQFSKDLIKSYASTPTKLGAVRAELVINYDGEDFEIGIGDLKYFINQVGNFSSDEIIVDFKEGKICLSSEEEKLKCVVPSTNPIYISRLIGTDEEFNKLITVDNPCTISEDICKKLFVYSSSLSCKEVIIKGKDKLLTFKAYGNKNDIVEKKFEIENSLKKEFNIKINRFVVDLFISLKSDIVVSAESENFLYVTKESEGYKVEYVLATYA